MAGDDGKTGSSSSNSSWTASSASSEMDHNRPPKDFMCPISGHVMADPVIIPTGQTFERGCIQACLDAGLRPERLRGEEERDKYSCSLSPATPLVPNLALRSAIFAWCDSYDVDRPRPILRDEAVEIVAGIAESTSGRRRTTTRKEEDFVDSFASLSAPSREDESSSSFRCLGASMSGSSSDEILQNQTPMSPLEEEILGKLKSSMVGNQSEGLVLLRETTRSSEEERTLLCTQTLLSSLRPFLFSRLTNLQSNAAAAIVNLSLDRANKAPIIRSGVVPPLVSALKTLNSEIRSHAVAAMFSLSTDESCRAAIGALGALPPLLNIFSKSSEDVGIRRDAALALYHLSTTCSTNRSKLVRMGAGKIILGVVSKQHLGKLVGVSLKVMANLALCTEGRTTLMDTGAVEVVVELLRKTNHHRDEIAATERRERCVEVLYGLSQGSLRFRGLAKATGADEVLRDMPEMGNEEDGSEGGETKVKKMAEKILRAISGGEKDYISGIASDSRQCKGVSDPGVILSRRRDVQRDDPFADIKSSNF